jgi:hypothetical protein
MACNELKQKKMAVRGSRGKRKKEKGNDMIRKKKKKAKRERRCKGVEKAKQCMYDILLSRMDQSLRYDLLPLWQH